MQQVVKSRGPLVWRDYDQEALDNAYDQLVYAPNRDLILGRIAAASQRTRENIGAPERVAYGPVEHERFDLFRAKGIAPAHGAPMNVFVHGGAWRQGSAADNALVAEPLVHAGAHAFILDFVNVDQAGGSIAPMHQQVSGALAFIWNNAERFGGDRNRFYVSAASSGAHLAGCALSRGWHEQKLPADFCKGAVLVSGMYDLAPVRLSKRSAYVKFTDEIEGALSPERHIDQINTPLVLVHGSGDTPEFQRQTKDFFAALNRAQKPAELIVADGYNHFELIESIGNPYGPAGRARLKQMGLN
ncbi:MAG TPA: alpha/beta hydrolase [Xanthobacteraceae bacterium]|jgi:arylformamidase